MSETADARTGITSTSERPPGYFADQCNAAPDHKRALASYIIGRRMIESGQSVFFDGGTTVSAIMRQLVKGSQTDLNILTNNMEVFRTYQEHGSQLNRRRIVLRLTGGRYDQPHEALYGIEARASVEKFNPHLLVMATSGLKLTPMAQSSIHMPTDGLYYHGGEDEGVIKDALMSHPTTHRLVVFDGTKLGRFDARTAGTLDRLWLNAPHVTFLTTQPEEGGTP